MFTELPSKENELQSCDSPSRRTIREVEEIVVYARLARYNRDMPCGPRALRNYLKEVLKVEPLPSERSIARILARNGLTHRRTGLYTGDSPNRIGNTQQPSRRRNN